MPSFTTPQVHITFTRDGDEDVLLLQYTVFVSFLLVLLITIRGLSADRRHLVSTTLSTGTVSCCNGEQQTLFRLSTVRLAVLKACNHDDELLDTQDKPGLLFAKISITFLRQLLVTDFLCDCLGVQPASAFNAEYSASLYASSVNDIA